MRRSVWIIWIVGAAVWAAAVVWPAIALLMTGWDVGPNTVDMRPVTMLLLTSTGWAVAVAAGAIVAGWVPGRWLGRVMRQRHGWLWGWMLMAPLCVPSYGVFYAWWQSWPSDSAVFRWVNSLGEMTLARHVTLYVSLVCWSWPLVAWSVAGRGAGKTEQIEDLLALDGAGKWFRFKLAVRQDARPLLLGGLLVVLATLNNTTCFDLSEVFTFANEVRATEALNATPGALLHAAWPGVAIAAFGAMLVWFALGGKRETEQVESRGRWGGAKWLSAAMVAVMFVLPAGLFARGVMREADLGAVFSEFWTLYGDSLINSVISAAGSAAVAVVVMFALTTAWADGRRSVRAGALVVSVSWLAVGLIPAVLVATALRCAYNKAMCAELYASPMMVNLGHLACLGFVAVLAARWVWRNEPKDVQEVRMLDGRVNIRGFVQLMRPTLVPGMVAVFALMTALCIGELACTVRITPPMDIGSGPLATAVLNAMHYQHPQTVMAAMLAMVVMGVVSSLAICGAWAAGSRFRRVGMITLLAVVGLNLAGCGRGKSFEAKPFVATEVFGSPGISPSQFNYPRALSVDHKTNDIYVVDKTARVQRFSEEGVLKNWWQMPNFENGKPTGISVGPDGNVYVADTHYYRVIVFTPEGKEIKRFGGIGNDPGQFIYTTDIAFGPEGKMYVSEYGGNDRVQIYDRNGQVIGAFGHHGKEEGEFDRPQSMVFNSTMTELYIADSCNHRIVVTDPEGHWLRTLGKAGRGVGELTFPYSVVMEDDDTLVISEFGNNRVQVLDAKTGASKGIIGCLGRDKGTLQIPWAVDLADNFLVILDSGNNRVQLMRKP